MATPFGYTNFDICSNTACQMFNPNVSPVTAIKTAQTNTAHMVLSADGVYVFFAEHAAESNLADDTDRSTGQALSTCGDGNVGEPTNNWPCMKDFVCKTKYQVSTHSRGMCQRGSARWASGLDDTYPPVKGASADTGQPILNADGIPIMPRDWRCILDHYYNASSNSATVQAPNTPNTPPGTGLRTAFIVGQPVFGYIAYEAGGSAQGAGIRAARAADGSADYLIVSGGRNPSWEPGGNRLAFENANGIAIINANGLGQQQITNEPLDFSPAWSPLGDKIAFCSGRAGSSVDIYVMKPDGTILQKITPAVQLQEQSYETEDCYLRWSPDGTQITFTGVTANIAYASRYNVYVMSSDGTGTPQQITNCQIQSPYAVPSDCATPSWSPDGKRIAFFDGDTPYGDALGGGGVYVVSADGTGPITPLYQNEQATSAFPQWSSDGKMIFFSPGPSPYAVWRINSDSTGIPLSIVPSTKQYSPFGIDCSRCSRFDK
jgi:Tol biopolymer transport system component